MPSDSRHTVLLTSIVGLLSVLLLNCCVSEPFIEVLDVRTNSDRTLLTSQVAIHNRSWFDVNFTVHHLFVGHTLFMNIHLKTDVNRRLVTFKRWKQIDLCRFLIGENRDPILNFMFENTLRDKSFLLCPFKVGSYFIKDAYLDATRIPDMIPKSKYRLFLEVTQMMGDFPKLFSLKIDAVFCTH